MNEGEIVCAECSKNYAAAAGKCPFCKKDKISNIVVGISFVVFLAVGVKKCQGSGTDHPAPQQTSESKLSPEERNKKSSDSARTTAYAYLHLMNKKPDSYSKPIQLADCMMAMDKAENGVIEWSGARDSCIEAASHL